MFSYTFLFRANSLGVLLLSSLIHILIWDLSQVISECGLVSEEDDPGIFKNGWILPFVVPFFTGHSRQREEEVCKYLKSSPAQRKSVVNAPGEHKYPAVIDWVLSTRGRTHSPRDRSVQCFVITFYKNQRAICSCYFSFTGKVALEYT